MPRFQCPSTFSGSVKKCLLHRRCGSGTRNLLPQACPDTGEREDLEAATVGEEQDGPSRWNLASPCCPDDVKTWAQVVIVFEG